MSCLLHLNIKPKIKRRRPSLNYPEHCKSCPRYGKNKWWHGLYLTENQLCQMDKCFCFKCKGEEEPLCPDKKAFALIQGIMGQNYG